jgi:peroxiredoxin Q/BCP
MSTLKTLANYDLPATTIDTINLSKLSGKNTVIYFYPKDSTPGCTIEGHNFRDLYPQFQEYNTEIFGVSRDSIKSHDKFKDKHDFPFELIADVEEQLCNSFDVIKQKSMFGKKVRGISRSTFLFDSKGKLIKEWRAVKVKGHAEEVLQT